MATMEKYKINTLAKELNVKNKDLIQLLTDHGMPAKSSMSTLESEELSLIFEYVTQKNQVDLTAYFKFYDDKKAAKKAEEEAKKAAEAEKAAADAYLAAGCKFGFADPDKKIPTTSTIYQLDEAAAKEDSIPSVTISAAEFEGEGLWIAKIMMDAGICKSSSDARRLIQGGAVSIDDNKVTDISLKVTLADIKDGSFTIRSGKKNFRKVILG